jgi:hypothetical protein
MYGRGFYNWLRHGAVVAGGARCRWCSRTAAAGLIAVATDEALRCNATAHRRFLRLRRLASRWLLTGVTPQPHVATAN